MKSENKTQIEKLIFKLEELWSDIYNFDYDREALWYIKEAKRNLSNIL